MKVGWLRNWTLLLLGTGMLLVSAPSGRAQGTTLAPLYLATTGSGTISPFQNAQLLEVGQSYSMTATADPDFLFNNWQAVNVFTLTAYIIDVSGSVPVTNINVSVTRSPRPEFFPTPVLQFTMQPEQLLYSTPASTLTECVGWQANFVPVPEPTPVILVGVGMPVIILIRHRRHSRARG